MFRTRTLRSISSIMSAGEIDSIADFVSTSSRLCILTGAGISTTSGIPDYRGENGSYKHGHVPMQDSAFISTATARQRYWARSFAAYPRFRDAKPNEAHVAVASMMKKKYAHGIITQNVDMLHEAAGAPSLHLHGTLRTATCLSCGAETCRDELQSVMSRLNPTLNSTSLYYDELRPDGDAPISDDVINQFQVPICSLCGGILKPSVVFFGGSIPQDIKSAAKDMIMNSDKLLVVGSSLEVFSAYRLVVLAADLKMPICIINTGSTKAERMGLKVDIKSNSNCSALLAAVDEII